ncbi:ErmE/ErmH/ErmO/ErmR family 23S rRNA (adenine(2058)-N(6))-methyltransferase [Thermomonospora echinospora]|uniref:ErmE/ErmH/ErmO/ErmR family 23S rRNA (adenine(2058)-N(6))-methyltransferase n=1 Tax=Thermomonospora echinospora TaxID=1992 RepID=UPI000CDECA39
MPAGRTARDRARRTLSQNFLIDPATIHHYARTVTDDLPGGALVVEVGAGDGRITTALAERAGHVIAYEIDPVLAGRLRAACAPLGNVRCVPGDFLRARPPQGPFHLAGSIPYAVTSRIVDWALAAPGLVSATLITQLEYARKRTGDYGRWSRLTVQTWPVFGWRLAGRIDRRLFRPVPRVDSAILRVDRRARPLLPPGALPAYRRCVEVGFGGRGGTLHASLRGVHPRSRVDDAFGAAGLDRGTVVAYVHPDQWVRLFQVLHANRP